MHFRSKAITEEVKACKAISNDQHRLKCFDGLFMDTPSQPNAAEKSANEENWQIEESKSPTDGSPLIVAANLAGDTMLFYGAKTKPPKLRFPLSTIFSAVGLLTLRRVSMTKSLLRRCGGRPMDGRAAFASNAVEFVRMLPDNARLFVRTSRSDGKTKEANFNLGHLSDIRNKIAHACDWGRTPNEPVGSVVTRSIANLFFCLISNLFL